MPVTPYGVAAPPSMAAFNAPGAATAGAPGTPPPMAAFSAPGAATAAGPGTPPPGYGGGTLPSNPGFDAFRGMMGPGGAFTMPASMAAQKAALAPLMQQMAAGPPAGAAATAGALQSQMGAGAPAAPPGLGVVQGALQAGPPGMSAMGAAPAASPAPYAPAPQPPGMDPLQRLMAARNRVFAGQMPMIGPRERAALAMTGGRRA